MSTATKKTTTTPAAAPIKASTTTATKPKSKEDLLKEKIAMFQEVAKPLLNLLYLAIPFVIRGGRFAHKVWSQLDQDAIESILGFVFCFFGGLYPTLFSAVQAAEYGGRAKLVEALGDLAEEATKILDESKKDDKIDVDGDGKADVDQLSSREFVERKTLLVLRKMNPQKVDAALSSIYSVWMCVMAVLAVQFARTVQMANSISDFMVKPVDRFIAPVVKAATPDQYDRWVPVVLGW
jgi:hypothetical protein